MQIQLRPGFKAADDQTVWIRTEGFDDGWECFNLKEITAALLEVCKNEDRLYPPPQFAGGEMLLAFVAHSIHEGAVPRESVREWGRKWRRHQVGADNVW